MWEGVQVLFCCLFKCYHSPASGWRRWEGYKTRMKAEPREVFIMLVDIGGGEGKGKGGRRQGRKGIGVEFYGVSHGVRWERNWNCWPLQHSRPRNISNILNKRVHIYYYFPQNIVPIFGPIKHLKKSKYSKHHQNVILSTHQSHLIKIYAVFPSQECPLYVIAWRVSEFSN